MSSKSTCCALALFLTLGAVLLGAPAELRAAEGELDLPGLDGGRLTAKELAAGDTIIVVWASWSPRSRDIGARVAAIAARWGKRARVVTVNFQESAEKARSFAREQQLDVPVYLDREAAFAKRYAVTSLPFLLVVRSGETPFAGKLPADPDAVIGQALR